MENRAKMYNLDADILVPDSGSSEEEMADDCEETASAAGPLPLTIR